MGHHFVPVDRHTPFLLPPSLQEWLPEDHLARFVELVEQLDLAPLEAAYAGRGSKAYHPGMLLALVFYGYATGVFSRRQLEAATYDSIAFRFISANTHPDHDTIARFRRRFLPQLEPLFRQILLVAAEMGFLKLGTVPPPGGSNGDVESPMKANASKHKALSYSHAQKLEAQLAQEVEELLALAEGTDREEEIAQLGMRVGGGAAPTSRLASPDGRSTVPRHAASRARRTREGCTSKRCGAP